MYDRIIASGQFVYDTSFIETVISAYEEFIMQTPEGMNYIAERLGLEMEGGESDREYHCVDLNVVVPAKDITFLKGVFVTVREKQKIQSGFMSVRYIDDYHLDKEQCDLCMSYTHCTKKVIDDNNNNKEVTACINCLTLSQSQKMRDQSGEGRKVCEVCTVASCSNNTLNKIRSIM